MAPKVNPVYPASFVILAQRVLMVDEILLIDVSGTCAGSGADLGHSASGILPNHQQPEWRGQVKVRATDSQKFDL